VEREQSGQSLVEFALILPILCIVLLGLTNLGLAIRARLQLAQVSQQAAQYLVHHPDSANPNPFVVTITGTGTFNLTTVGCTGTCTTGPINYGASAAGVQSALGPLSNVNNDVTVTGSNGGPYTVTFGPTATVAGMTFSSSTSMAGTVTPRYANLVNYMNSLSSYQLTPLSVNLTVGTSTAGTSIAQLDTVSISYPFPVIFPMVGKLSVGTLQGGTIKLGASASTVAATHPVSNLHVCTVTAVSGSCTYDSSGITNTSVVGQHQIRWDPPVESGPSPTGINLPLKYCITSYYTTQGGSGTLTPLDLGCQGPWTGNSTLFYKDITDYSTIARINYSNAPSTSNAIYYSVVAQQLDGVQSAVVSKTYQ
jgi:Flp pilus assembly protein TadG